MPRASAACIHKVAFAHCAQVKKSNRARDVIPLLGCFIREDFDGSLLPLLSSQTSYRPNATWLGTRSAFLKRLEIEAAML
jgi:hypothetical protein